MNIFYMHEAEIYTIQNEQTKKKVTNINEITK